MKKLLTICLLLATTFTANAQQLSSGDYTATISNLKTRSYTKTLFGSTDKIIEYIGDCTIEKKGSKKESYTFSTMQIGDFTLTLNVKILDEHNSTLSYDFESEKFELGGEEYKAKSSKNMKNIFLSGILIYAKWIDEEY